MFNFKKYRQLFREDLAKNISDLETSKKVANLYKGRERQLLLNDIKLMEDYRDNTRYGQEQHFRAIIKNGIGVHLTTNKSVSVAAPKNSNSFENL